MPTMNGSCTLLDEEPVDDSGRVVCLLQLREIPGALDGCASQGLVRGDEAHGGRGVGEAWMVAEDKQGGVGESLVGAFRARIVEQPAHERQRSAVGTGLLAGPPAVPLIVWRDPRRISKELPEEPADHLPASEDRKQLPTDPRSTQEPVKVSRCPARAALEASETGGADEHDPPEPLRVIGRGDDDVLRRERERDDIDGSLAGLKCGRADALELLTVERPAIGRVGPLRRAKAEPVD